MKLILITILVLAFAIIISCKRIKKHSKITAKQYYNSNTELLNQIASAQHSPLRKTSGSSADLVMIQAQTIAALNKDHSGDLKHVYSANSHSDIPNIEVYKPNSKQEMVENVEKSNEISLPPIKELTEEEIAEIVRNLSERDKEMAKKLNMSLEEFAKEFGHVLKRRQEPEL